MSEDEIHRRLRDGYEAFNRRDYDRVLALFHPDVEYIPAGGLEPVRGAEAIRAWMQPSAFARQVLEAREVTFNGDTALVRTHAAIRGAGSGIEMEIETWSVITQDADGLVTCIQSFFLHDEEQARAAAGLGGDGSG